MQRLLQVENCTIRKFLFWTENSLNKEVTIFMKVSGEQFASEGLWIVTLHIGTESVLLANEYSCAHGAQINFGDLAPYLTYELGVSKIAIHAVS